MERRVCRVIGYHERLVHGTDLSGDEEGRGLDSTHNGSHCVPPSVYFLHMSGRSTLKWWFLLDAPSVCLLRD